MKATRAVTDKFDDRSSPSMVKSLETELELKPLGMDIPKLCVKEIPVELPRTIHTDHRAIKPYMRYLNLRCGGGPPISFSEFSEKWLSHEEAMETAAKSSTETVPSEPAHATSSTPELTQPPPPGSPLLSPSDCLSRTDGRFVVPPFGYPRMMLTADPDEETRRREQLTLVTRIHTLRTLTEFHGYVLDVIIYHLEEGRKVITSLTEKSK